VRTADNDSLVMRPFERKRVYTTALYITRGSLWRFQFYWYTSETRYRETFESKN